MQNVRKRNLRPLSPHRSLLSLLVLLTLVRGICAASPGAKEAVSANGHFAFELTQASDEELLVAVFDTSKKVRTLSWSRKVHWPLGDEPAWSRSVYDFKVLVTNDGNTV